MNVKKVFHTALVVVISCKPIAATVTAVPVVVHHAISVAEVANAVEFAAKHLPRFH